MPEKTAADKHHDVFMLILGFLLTTVVGGTLGFFYQSSQERLQIKELRRSEATKLFEDISRLMDTRLYRWRQVAWAIEDGKPAGEIWKRYDAYQQTLFEWSDSVNRNRALLCRYFGPKAGLTFETEIMPAFRSLQDALSKNLETARPERKDSFDRSQLNPLADHLNHLIYTLNNDLAESIREGNIGLADPGSNCDFQKEAETIPKPATWSAAKVSEPRATMP